MLTEADPASASIIGDVLKPTNDSENNNTLPHIGSPPSLEHYKYLRSVLPTLPHVIESFSFSDAQNWTCTLQVALLNESDCTKWLGDFAEATNTVWRSEQGLPQDEERTTWATVFRCLRPPDGLIECAAKLDMAISNNKVSKSGKQPYPCLVQINFFHNHELKKCSNDDDDDVAVSLAQHLAEQPLEAPSFKSEIVQVSFDEFFLTDSNTGNGDSVAASVIQSTLGVPTSVNGLHSLEDSMQVNPASVQPRLTSSQQPPSAMLHVEEPLQVMLQQAVTSDDFQNSQLFSLDEVSRKLNEFNLTVMELLKKTGTACAAVKQFTDVFDQLKTDGNALENALISFGSQQVSSLSLNMPSLPQVDPAATSSIVPQWSMTPLTSVAGLTITSNSPTTSTSSSNNVNSAATTSASIAEEAFKTLKKIKKKRKKGMPTVLPGQIDPITGKRRKRSRCGTCQGCINRDKTQDCRVCRNCLDQKRYGGPGRLKKACVRRSCVIMATSEGQTTVLAQTPPAQIQISPSSVVGGGGESSSSSSGNNSISLPIHPVPVTSSAGGSSQMATITTSVSDSQPSDSTTPSSATVPQPITLTARPANTATAAVTSAVLSWPSTSNASHFSTTTFQIPPVQFTYEAQTSFDPSGNLTGDDSSSSFLAAAASVASAVSEEDQLDSITSEAAKQHGIE